MIALLLSFLPRRTLRRDHAVLIGVLLCFCVGQQASAETAPGPDGTLFKRVPSQYIAALGDWDASAGAGAETWGIWRKDPGPRGVWLRNFPTLMDNDGVADAGWQFDASDWWLDENGLLMEDPVFPMPAGRYIVTGGRETVSVLTVEEPDSNGEQRWALSDDATLYDVTHLRCRSARYTHATSEQACSPTSVDQSLFRIVPGAAMPDVEHCAQQEYIVLIIVGVEAGA